MYLCLGREERETRVKNYLTALVHSQYPCCSQEMAEILVWNRDLFFSNSSHFAYDDYLYIRKCYFKKVKHLLHSCFTGNEAALFMRLHLLQAIVLFHQNKRQEASKLLARADFELSALKVDDHSLSTLMELGMWHRFVTFLSCCPILLIQHFS
jgi:hypothetical protein